MFSDSRPLTCECWLPGIYLVTQVAKQDGKNNNQSETEADCHAYVDFYKLRL